MQRSQISNTQKQNLSLRNRIQAAPIPVTASLNPREPNFNEAVQRVRKFVEKGFSASRSPNT